VRAVTYDPEPSYPLVRGEIGRGYPRLPRGVLAIDGPAALRWDALAASLADARELRRVRMLDRTVEPAIPGDPALQGFASDLAEFLAPCVAAFSPSCVVVGGSVARAWT